MAANDYEYRDGVLWVRLVGLGSASETHADLLRALSLALAQLSEEGAYRPGLVFPLYQLLNSLLPTDDHLRNGQIAVVIKANKKK